MSSSRFPILRKIGKLRLNRRRASEQGYILVAVLVLFSLSLSLTMILLNASAVGRGSIASVRTAETEYLDAEATAQEAFQWLNATSRKWGSLFSGGVFTKTFVRNPIPSVGLNDSGSFNIPTRVKIAGTNNSAILHSDPSTFGIAAFPQSNDLISGELYQPTKSFQEQIFARGKVRVTLVDAIPLDPSNLNSTEYSPVFRIDAMKAAERGGHVSMIVTGKMQTAPGSGFIGKTYVEMRQSCDSYQSSTSIPNFSSQARRANCPIASEGSIAVHSTSTIFGSVTTKSTLATGSPWEGPICASFASGCPVKGTICTGSTCQTPILNLSPSSFSAACPNTAPDLMIPGGYSELTAQTIESIREPSSSTNTPPGTPARTIRNNCWQNLKIGANGWARFRSGLSGSAPVAFYIKNLEIAKNARVLFDDNGGKQITLYVDRIVGDTYNGNQIGGLKSSACGSMVAPNMLKLNYWGSYPLTLNGNATINSFLVAPNAAVTISGNFTFHGGIMADRLVANGSGALHYDETGGNAVNVDMQLRIRSIQEYFR
jgi:hypothetical protein